MADEPGSNPAGEALRAEIGKAMTDPSHPGHAAWKAGGEAWNAYTRPMYEKVYGTGTVELCEGREVGGPRPAQSAAPARDEFGRVASTSDATLRVEVGKIMSDKTHPMYEGYHRSDPKVMAKIDEMYRQNYGTGKVEIGEGLSLQAGGAVETQPAETPEHAEPSGPLQVPPAPEGMEWTPAGGQAIAEAARDLGVSEADTADLAHYCVARVQAADAGEASPDPAATEATLRRECEARGESYEDMVLAARLVYRRLPPMLQEEFDDPALGDDPQVIRRFAARGTAMAKAYREIPTALQTLDTLPRGSREYAAQDRRVSALYQACYGTRQIVIE